MKKNLIPMLVLVVVMIATTATPALAHGHNKKTVTKKYAVCTVTDCTLTGVHKHNNINFYGHYYGDGHDYHGICDVSDCALNGYHEHDGSYCFSHYSGDGHNYHDGNGHH